MESDKTSFKNNGSFPFADTQSELHDFRVKTARKTLMNFSLISLTTLIIYNCCGNKRFQIIQIMHAFRVLFLFVRDTQRFEFFKTLL